MKGISRQTQSWRSPRRVGLDVERLKTDMESEEVAAALAHNMSLAQKLGIQGTPAFVVDETLIPGAVGYEGLVASVQASARPGWLQTLLITRPVFHP